MIERHDQGQADPQIVFDHSCLYLLRLSTWMFILTALSFIRMNVLFAFSQLLVLFPEGSPLHKIRHAEDLGSLLWGCNVSRRGERTLLHAMFVMAHNTPLYG